MSIEVPGVVSSVDLAKKLGPRRTLTDAEHNLEWAIWQRERMRRYDLLDFQTPSEAEAAVQRALAREGWAVTRRGWPDLLATRYREDHPREVRLIEVKRPGQYLSSHQEGVAAVLGGYGLHVELLTAALAEDDPERRGLTLPALPW